MTDMGKRAGDMDKEDYDANEDGTVDNAAKLEGSSKAEVQDHTPKSHTHEEAEITDLDHNALKIAGKEVDDSAIGDQKTLAYDDGSGKIIYITPAPSGAAISSIQVGEVTIIGGQSSGTAAINSVDLTKSVIIFLGFRAAAGATVETASARVELTGATTVTAYQNGGSANTVRFMVVEFSSGIESSQGGTVQLDNQTTNDTTIDEVDTSKSVLVHLGQSCYNNEVDRAFGTLSFLNSTTVRLTSTQADGRHTAGFHVLEFS